jgi:hypothetical protein
LGVVGVVPPELEGDVPEPEELVVEELDAVDAGVDLVLEAADSSDPGSGVNGLRAVPACCLDVPLVVSEIGWLGFAGAWLTATPATTVEPEEADTATVLVEEPPPNTA